MKLIDILILAVICAILGCVVLYIRKAKKKGVQCIGCPDAAQCAGKCSGCPGNCSSCCMNKH